MKASALIDKLKSIETPFDEDLTDSEMGPYMQSLLNIEHGVPFIVLTFGEGKGLKKSEAIARLENFCAEAPFDPTVTNSRLGDNHQELLKVYHEPPVTILEFNYGEE